MQRRHMVYIIDTATLNGVFYFRMYRHNGPRPRLSLYTKYYRTLWYTTYFTWDIRSKLLVHIMCGQHIVCLAGEGTKIKKISHTYIQHLLCCPSNDATQTIMIHVYVCTCH